MRRVSLRAVPVCLVALACGCFLTDGSREQKAAGAPPSPTHDYWYKVGAILARRPAGADLPNLLALVRDQTEALRGLPTDGVDPELVAAVAEVIAREQDVLDRAELFDGNEKVLRSSKEMAGAFAGANRAAAEAKKRVRGLQPALNARHGGGFNPLAG
ncbi:MAG: hypothetical protein K2V38_12110 [Gemmataceae bacterium]|nr:hypothetical protein [Gemmataceae bacterium]